MVSATAARNHQPQYSKRNADNPRNFAPDMLHSFVPVTAQSGFYNV
jgi:hypothetical protein